MTLQGWDTLSSPGHSGQSPTEEGGQAPGSLGPGPPCPQARGAQAALPPFGCLMSSVAGGWGGVGAGGRRWRCSPGVRGGDPQPQVSCSFLPRLMGLQISLPSPPSARLPADLCTEGSQELVRPRAAAAPAPGSLPGRLCPAPLSRVHVAPPCVHCLCFHVSLAGMITFRGHSCGTGQFLGQGSNPHCC